MSVPPAGRARGLRGEGRLGAGDSGIWPPAGDPAAPFSQSGTGPLGAGLPAPPSPGQDGAIRSPCPRPRDPGKERPWTQRSTSFPPSPGRAAILAGQPSLAVGRPRGEDTAQDRREASRGLPPGRQAGTGLRPAGGPLRAPWRRPGPGQERGQSGDARRRGRVRPSPGPFIAERPFRGDGLTRDRAWGAGPAGPPRPEYRS